MLGREGGRKDEEGEVGWGGRVRWRFGVVYWLVGRIDRWMGRGGMGLRVWR